MYHVRYNNQEQADVVRAVLLAHIELSRFKVTAIYVEKHARYFLVNIEQVRLRTNKPYCGNHAGPCRVEGRRHRSLAFLEGLDWVSFNNLVNDALDTISHDGDTGNDQVNVRRGRCRRIGYHGFGHGDWCRFAAADEYADYCGQPSPSADVAYPAGTPGELEWRNHDRIQLAR